MNIKHLSFLSLLILIIRIWTQIVYTYTAFKQNKLILKLTGFVSSQLFCLAAIIWIYQTHTQNYLLITFQSRNWILTDHTLYWALPSNIYYLFAKLRFRLSLDSTLQDHISNVTEYKIVSIKSYSVIYNTFILRS